jgi:glycosyltransferase involved in cell wall biosynthesis
MLYKAHLEARGHDVTVFTLGKPDPAGEDDGVVRSRGVLLGQTGYYFAPRYSRAAQEKVAQMDIVHCHHLYMSVEFGRKYATPGTPIVYTNHTRYDLYTASLFHLPWSLVTTYHRTIWPQRAALADAIIAPSAELRDLMRGYGVKAPIHVIENGIDVDFYANPPAPKSKAKLGYAEDDVVAIYVGRISAEKRIDDLIAQFELAYQRCPKLRLLLIGPGSDIEKVRHSAETRGLADVVRVMGVVPFDSVPNYLASADFFVTASHSEVHPLTLIEALAAGLPIVACDVHGMRESVTNGYNGLLTPSTALHDGMTTLATNATIRAALGVNAREAGSEFDFARTVNATVKLYERLL